MIYSLLLFRLVYCGYISTWDMSLEYDIEGKISLINIPFSLETSINSGFFQLGGVELHQLQMNEVSCTITTLDGQSVMKSAASLTTQPSFTSDYYFQISQQLDNNKWYNLQISPTKVDSGFYYEPIILRTISSLDDNAMIYDFNYGAGHLNVDELPPSGMAITFNIDDSLYPNYKYPGAQYVITIQITPRVSTSGVEIDLQIVAGSTTVGIDEYDFTILSQSCWSNFVLYTCTTTTNSVKLITSNELVANTQIQIQFGIENPGFVSNRDIRVVTKSPSQGNRILEKGFRSSVFDVSPFEANFENVDLLWGIKLGDDLTYSQSQIFIVEDQTKLYGPYNSIKASFSVTQNVNLVYPLQVTLTLDCDYALSYTTKHNFQQFDEKNPVYCEFVSRSIICHNVGTLSSSNVYYISTKAIYLSPPSATQFTFTLSLILEQNDTPNILTVYDVGNTVTAPFVSDNNFLDNGVKGWHEASVGFLGQTQVTSIPDVSLTNLNSVFGSSGTIGIVNGDNMILFFLKVPNSAFSTGTSCAPANNVYSRMTILMNSQVLHGDQQNIPRKLQYLANDGGGVYLDEQLICVKNGFCDSGDQNTYDIYSSSNAPYGVASFISQGCTSNFQTENNNLIGTTASATPGQNGVFGIPVSFSSNFVHSSQYADENLLDFIVSFYEVVGGVEKIKSQHLINAYTINRITDIKASFINYFQGTSNGNNGQYIPTMVRIVLPSLTVSFDKIQIFFDTKIDLLSSYSDCQVFDSINSHTEVWMFHQSVICDKQNQVIIPIIPNGLTKTLHVALTTTINGILSQNPVKVYRIFGLQVNGETRKLTTSLFSLDALASLTFPYIKNSKLFDLKIDTTKFIDGQAFVDLELSTSVTSNVDLEQNQNNFVGAGLTLTSRGINIFDEATITSYFGQLSCSQFVYNTNIYTTFCPFDSQIHYPLSISNQIVFLLGQNTQLGSIVSYAISSIKGVLMAAINDPGQINRVLYTCTLDKTSLIYPNSLGQQRLQFPLRFSSSIKLGGVYYGSIQVVITLQGAITGVNILATTNVCSIEGLSQISCTYTATSSVITATLISSITQTIKANSVIKLTFLIQSTYGLATFGSNQPFKISIYVPTIRSTVVQIYGDTYDATPVLQEQCTYTSLNLQSTSLGNKFYVGNLKLETPTTSAIGKLTFDFKILSSREYLSSSQQYIQFTLGFLRDQNMQNGKLKCQIYQSNVVSTLIYSIDTSTMPYITVKFNQDIQNPHLILFTMKCNNFQTPTDTFQSETLIGKLIEKVGITTLQTSTPIGYSSLNLISYQTQGSITLISKQFNSPGFDAIYQFQITNGELKILLTYLIKLKFHDGISLSSDISCQMNTTFCYCSLQDGVYMINACLLVLPQQQVILTITVPQPNRVFWPTSSLIFITIDQDDDYSNGVYMQQIVSDSLADEYQTQAIEIIDTTLSSYYIRTTQTHKIILLLPSGSVGQGNMLFIKFPAFYMDVLTRATQITCSLTRDDDALKTNFTTSCTLITSQYIQMILQEDSANNLIKQYTIEIGNIPLPEKSVPQQPWNQFRLKVQIIQQGYTRVKFSSAFYYSQPLSLIAEDKIDVLWSGGQFSYERDENLKLINEVTDIINIYIGTYRTLIRLKALNLANYIETFGIQQNSLKTFPEDLSANSGSSDAIFLVGAPSSLQIGYQIFQFSKLTGGISYVSVLPNIYANIINSPCQLTTDLTNYQVSQGGTSQPIVINVESCYPMQDLRIELINNSSALNPIFNNPQNIIYSGNNPYQLYFDKYEYIWLINNNDTVLEIGDKVELSFSLSGVSSAYYTPPPNIFIEIVATSVDYPIIEFDSQPIAYKNDIKFSFKCNNQGTLLWVIGCGGDIIYIPLDEIYNRTLYQGYMRTQRNLSDVEWKLYGAQIMNGVVNEHFSGLKSYSDYTLQAYCIDSMSLSSEPLVYTWQTSFNGGKGIKLNVTFNSPLTSIQQLELVCGANFIFTIDYSRITDSRGYNCDIDTLSILSSSANDQASTLTGKITSYYIYIQPDLSLMDETINTVVQNALSIKKTFIQLLQNKMNIDPEEDPTIVDVIYSEPDQSIKPTINYTLPVVGSVNATMNFTLSKAKGYVGIGVEQTDTAQIPSITQIRRSINYLGRALLQTKLLFFNQSSAISNETQQVWFTDLSPNLKYRIYFFYSNDDTGSLALISNVTSIQIQTSPSQSYSLSKLIQAFLIFILVILT